jgi:hypothetical protein
MLGSVNTNLKLAIICIIFPYESFVRVMRMKSTGTSRVSHAGHSVECFTGSRELDVALDESTEPVAAFDG